MAENDTARLGLPLLMPAQAQKHVTVNEALMRLDGLVGLVLQSTSVTTPPDVVTDGLCWAVPDGAGGDWQGQGGQIAIGANGGWVFRQPALGLRAFVADRGLQAIHDGRDWVTGAITLGLTGAGLLAGLAEGEVTITPGASVTSDVQIPAHSLVIGATARVSAALTGNLSGWQLGTPGAENRFGQGLGKETGSWARGMLGQPMTYWQAENLILTAENGQFAGGKVKIAVHWLALRLPD
ncbi:DUF2793 domain-containing protein [Paracoccus zhejiangensis]|uniref:DUF2793 domain-containing protein n=1 Tax=Paracoccus zhejiangensis TaxID=1077935 RepID=A0A2H5EV23_9RHOB|nr:DUF2793 domain-containing protein [Paracoccus zhejiangensis]AUH63141.1 hypothetical protein CX676_02360 [Paracoccus zhejiangensis]